MIEEPSYCCSICGKKLKKFLKKEQAKTHYPAGTAGYSITITMTIRITKKFQIKSLSFWLFLIFSLSLFSQKG
jgi:hypothetical protein